MKTTYKTFGRLKGILLILIILMGFTGVVAGQDYTSRANGTWTSGLTWTGGSAPATSGQGWGTVTVNHNITIAGSYSTEATLNVNSTKTLTINSNLSISNGATINVYGKLVVGGSATFDANLRIHPGGTVIINGNATIRNSTYVTVGTNVAPPAYADFVVKGNLISQNSGRTTLNRNARVAVFGNYTSDGAGSGSITINNGGQIYIHGNISLVDSSDRIQASNTTPRGLYVNGTTTGGTVTSFRGTRTTMQTNDTPFYNWVLGLEDSPLPITLIFFKVDEMTASEVKLAWATAMEKNFDKFVIERSSNGLTFEAIGEIKGAGDSEATLHYSFTDKNVLTGATNYYRLKSIDLDRSFEYSKVIYATVDGEKEVNVYPNPSTGEYVNYRTNFDPQADDRIVVIDLSGAQVAAATVFSNEGKITFNTVLKRGTYFIKYTSADYEKIERLVIE